MSKTELPSATALEPLHAELRGLIGASRQRLAGTVNAELTRLYWSVGRRLAVEALGGERAQYGAQLMDRLGERLVQEFGRGFEAKNLRRMVQFAQAFTDAAIVATLSRQLSWSHLVALLPLKTSEAQLHYHLRRNWSKGCTRRCWRRGSGWHGGGCWRKTWMSDAESRGMNMPRLGTDTGKAAPFALAPRKEKIRIADQLDSPLARVQACNDRIDAIPALLKRFGQTVLDAASSGSMTDDWWNSDQAPWTPVQLAEVASDFSYGSSAKSAKVGSVPVLRMGNIQSGRLIRVRCLPTLLPEYLNYCLGSNAGRGDHCWSVKSDGVSQSNINAKKLAAFRFLLPSFDEQPEIVRRVEGLLKLADRIEARHTAARAQAQRLTPLLLAKAFRGELVPQDPNDEPATDLLERDASAPGAASRFRQKSDEAARRQPVTLEETPCSPNYT
ncbi:MAG: DUF1016 N-terminal domain-containing protein [Sulfuricella sp.]|nr:DUF1016 N-terminal domain-containing protein [Sulfuricella sp.]